DLLREGEPARAPRASRRARRSSAVPPIERSSFATRPSSLRVRVDNPPHGDATRASRARFRESVADARETDSFRIPNALSVGPPLTLLVGRGYTNSTLGAH